MASQGRRSSHSHSRRWARSGASTTPAGQVRRTVSPSPAASGAVVRKAHAPEPPSHYAVALFATDPSGPVQDSIRTWSVPGLCGRRTWALACSMGSAQPFPVTFQ